MLHRVIFTLKGIVAVRPQRLHHLDGFPVARLALGVVDAEVGVLRRRCAPAESHVQPAVAQHVQRRRVLRQPYRVMQRRNQHRRTQPDSLRPGRDVAGDDERRRPQPVPGEMVLGQPDRLEPEFLSRSRLLGQIRVQALGRKFLRPRYVGKQGKIHFDLLVGLWSGSVHTVHADFQTQRLAGERVPIFIIT